MNTVCIIYICFRLDDIAVGEPFFNKYDVGTFDTGRVYVLYQGAQVCTGGECMCFIREHRCVQGGGGDKQAWLNITMTTLNYVCLNHGDRRVFSI